ncbi:WecB/TagA/CpsF family glycosyltransferase [Mesorhizobium sp. KR1-2]|uniref:WecB/TagA/CpsF family glycosyltransferase n=1 Tax=Mesorhizobium sp. KR1-2 TaxID=3156609 RepID=UPI0032B52153
MLAERRFTKVSFLNAHNANTDCRDAEFAAALYDFLILPDGIGVDIASKLLYGAPFPANLNGTDLIPGFLQASAEQHTVGLVGTTRENAETAAKTLSALAGQHRFAVIHDGFSTVRPSRKSLSGFGSCALTSCWSPWPCRAPLWMRR